MYGGGLVVEVEAVVLKSILSQVDCEGGVAGGGCVCVCVPVLYGRTGRADPSLKGSVTHRATTYRATTHLITT